jgi:hypothetical protein
VIGRHDGALERMSLLAVATVAEVVEWALRISAGDFSNERMPPVRLLLMQPLRMAMAMVEVVAVERSNA